MPRRTFTTLLLMAIVLLCLLVVRKAELLRSREKVLTADEAYEALHAEYTAAAENLQQTAAAARSDRERQYVSQTLFPELNARFAGRYLDIVRKYPQDPRGIEATLWLCTRPDWGEGTVPAQDEAIELLTSHHIEDPSLSRLFPRIASVTQASGTARLLQAIGAKSPHEGVRALAAYWLAQRTRLQADLAYYAKKPDAQALAQQASEYFEGVVRDFPDLRVQGRPLRSIVQDDLYRHRVLGLGQPAPEIAAEDVEGGSFKLSDYRGKVVLLSFWAFW